MPTTRENFLGPVVWTMRSHRTDYELLCETCGARGRVAILQKSGQDELFAIDGFNLCDTNELHCNACGSAEVAMFTVEAECDGSR